MKVRNNYEWRERATEFFLEWVKVKEGWLDYDGTMFLPTMKEAARLLLDNGIFDSVEEMKESALMDYGIILPDDLFRKGKK